VKRLKIPRAQQLRLRENQLFLALTIVVGVLAGLAAVLFSLGIDLVTRGLFGVDPSPARLFAVPALMSVVTGILLVTVFPDVRGSGVPQTKAAFHLHGGVIPGRVPLGKFVTGVLCIGSGHSIGREGPSVQIGAGLASIIGQRLSLPPERLKDLVPVGAAGALAAAFNTPVAAVLFALEEIIGDLNAALIGSAVLASVASVVVQRSILGNEPLFHVPEYHLQHPAELLAYAGLGLAGGIVSVLFCKGLLGLRAAFLRLPPRTRIGHPALGGLVIGGVLIGFPEVMGVGYEYVDQALNGGMVLRTMMILGVVKIAATIISYASGNAGGVFAPSLYIGAMVGGAIGIVVREVAPFPTADAGAYALVGMGTLFAGIVRAPMTSVFMIFEITQDYQILVPLMVANLLSFMISRHYQPVPVYHALLQQDRVHLPSLPSRSERRRTAAEVMTAEVALIPAGRSIEAVWREAPRDGRAVLVGERDGFIGVATGARLVEAVNAGQETAPIESIVERPVVHVHPDHPLDVVVERLAAGGGVLPVIARDDTARLLGLITLEDVVRFMQGAPPRARP
jgi:CIC family chloride channel protein